MRVLVVGGGAREHALVRALRADPAVTAVIAAPGNAGIAAEVEIRPLDVADPGTVAELAFRLAVDLVVVGPEVPLVAGAADAVRAAGIDCFGPSAAAAQLEGSKAFAKEVMAAAGVPTARALVCSTPDEAAAALDELGSPYVVKDDGLAAGKGVVVTTDRAEALAHAATCDAGRRSRSSWTGRRCRCSRSATARPCCRWCRRRTSSGSATTTRARTPAGWVPTRRCRGRRTAWSTRCSPTCCSRRSTRWRAAARRSPACCTPGWR